jgi:hypothetical protein
MKEEIFKERGVGHARWLTRQYGVRGVVVLVFEHERISGVSYGETKAECKKLGQVLDSIVDELQLEGPDAWRP